MKKYNIEKLREKLERCKNISFNDISLDDVDDISTIKISKKKNEYEKILDFIENTKNPYIFKSNDKFIKIEFSNNDRKAEECLTNVLKDLYR
ncbi:MAG: hypothetical protein J6D28_03985 [Bacilli bacterium]|nr:hypothetical protein [Bacilli bacterium]